MGGWRQVGGWGRDGKAGGYIRESWRVVIGGIGRGWRLGSMFGGGGEIEVEDEEE